MKTFSIKGNIADIRAENFFAGEITINGKRIASISRHSSGTDPALPFIIPGFIDSHVHIESSMLVPAEFARIAVTHGTVATISDPHEIANVCGMKGVDYMIANGNTVNFKFHFGAPSCVPATSFETSGDVINSDDVAELLARKDILYLSEMMNFPGVISNEEEVMKKISAAIHASKPIDGHAPALRGEALAKYVGAGISTDHECFSKEEALEKLSLGMKILIREGSAARNFEALIDLLDDYPDEVMFCSDDKHPDSLVQGHINQLCNRAVRKGINIFKVLKAACVNPVLHYGLNIGLLKENDSADFILIKDVETFNVISTYINGECVYNDGISFIQPSRQTTINRFSANEIEPDTLICHPSSHLIEGKLPVIEALDGQLITKKLLVEPEIRDGSIVSSISNDILKLVVVNRYRQSTPAVSFIRNFGIKTGAIASSVAHDSHNVIATGADDVSITNAINLVISHQGGISYVSGDEKRILPLPVGGLMSTDDGFRVADEYTHMNTLVKSLGSSLAAPFMTLSFMALLVIPSLKLSDKGLFDADNFRFVYK